jgi:branched-chain amino acid transport system permease protein
MPTRPLATRYEDHLRLFPGRWHQSGLVAAVALLLVFPFVANPHWLTVANLAMTTTVGAVGLMILSGFTGQISLGHAAFLALGAYTAAVLGTRFGVPFWLILPVAGGVAAAVGLVVGPFALRLRGLYLAIVTLGLLFVVNHLLLSFPQWTGGVAGIAVPVHTWFAEPGTYSLASGFAVPVRIGPLRLSFEHKLYFLFLVLTLLAVWCGKNLQRSNAGRAMMAVRDHDIAAEVMGVDPARVKIIAFGISSFLAGVAGAMFAFQQQYITVDPPFNLFMSIEFIAIIVIGGIGTVWGAVAGTLVFTAIGPLAHTVGEHIPVIDRLSSAQQGILALALVVCLFMVLEPLGLFGIWLRIKRYFMAWPFRY